MTNLKIIAMPTKEVDAYRSGSPDANNQVPEHHTSTGFGNPCRHCLKNIKEGEKKLILAHRPFPDIQPYAEIGPIFLHAESCEQHDTQAGIPAMLKHWGMVLAKGYGDDNRIQYQSTRLIPASEIETQCTEMLEDQNVAYLHIRTAQYNCYQCRIERAE